MAQTDIRFWQDPARNRQVSVTYDDTAPRRVFFFAEPMDPAFPMQGGPPRDNIAAGTILLRVCEGLDEITLTAISTAPFATIAVLANAPACDLSTLAIVRITGYAPISPATTGRGEVQLSGGLAPYSVTLTDNAGATFTVNADASGLAAFASLPPRVYAVAVLDAASPRAGRVGSLIVPTLDTPGCPLPGALNYNPAATTNDGSCVFVAVDAEPAGLVAAHLPVPVLLRAAPIASQPAIVYLFIETATTTAGPWALVGQLRQTADPIPAAVAFNVSEVCKAQFASIAPPVETGLDASLSRLLRLRYLVQSSAGVDTYAGTLTPFRALNAALTPPADGVLTLAAAYLEQPPTAVLWRNLATLAAGVSAEPLALPLTGCAARHFVWLNRLGGWQSGFFSGRHVRGTDQADPITFRDQAGADRYASRGQVRPTLQVYSDKLSFTTYQAVRGIRDSIQVYERTGANTYLPVLVASGSYTEYQEQTDKTFTVDFTISYPAVLVQTQ